jgi:hypothetical protein
VNVCADFPVRAPDLDAKLFFFLRNAYSFFLFCADLSVGAPDLDAKLNAVVFFFRAVPQSVPNCTTVPLRVFGGSSSWTERPAGWVGIGKFWNPEIVKF